MNQKQVKVMKRPDYLKITSELDPWLESLSYYRKQIAKDASCLFRIVAENVTLMQDDHNVIRGQTCDYLRDHKDKFAHMVEGDYEEYVENMRNYKTHGTSVEIAAMSLLFKKDFLIFEEVGQSPRKATDNNFKDIIMMSIEDGCQYCAVYPKKVIEQAGSVQSLATENFYKGVYNDKTVMDEKTKLLQPSENSSQSENVITYKAAKNLDPTVYRNSDFDAWVHQAKDESKNGVRFKNGLGAGSKVKIQLDAKHPEITHEGYIQKIPYEGAPVNVFLANLGVTKSVPYNSIIPLEDPIETPTSQNSRSLPGSPAPIRAPAFQSPQFQGPFPPQPYGGAPFHPPQQYSRTPPYPPHNYVRPPPVYPSSGERKRNNFSYRHNEGGGRSYGMNPLPPRYQQQAGPRHYSNDGRTFPNRTLNNNTKTGNRYTTETKKDPDSKARRPKEIEDVTEATPNTNGDKPTEKPKIASEDAQAVVSVAATEKKAPEAAAKGGYDRRRRRTDDDRSSYSSRFSNRANIPFYQNGPGVSAPLLQAPMPPLIQGAPLRPPFPQEGPQAAVHYTPSTTAQGTNCSTGPLTISLTQPAAQDPNLPLAQVPYGVSMYPFQFPQYPATQPAMVNVGDGYQTPVAPYTAAGGVYPPNVFPQPYPVPYQTPMLVSGGTAPDMSVQVAPPESFVTDMRSSPTSSGYNSAPMSPEDRARTYSMGVRFPTTIPVAVQGAVPPASYELPRITDVQEQFQQMSILTSGDGNVQFYTGQPMMNQPHNTYPYFLPQPPYIPFEFGPAAPNNN